jgi:hypothetical protein
MDFVQLFGLLVLQVVQLALNQPFVRFGVNDVVVQQFALSDLLLDLLLQRLHFEFEPLVLDFDFVGPVFEGVLGDLVLGTDVLHHSVLFLHVRLLLLQLLLLLVDVAQIVDDRTLRVLQVVVR